MQTKIDIRLARHGAILLLLGMLTGFLIRSFHNRGAGNAAHLVGLIGGYGLFGVAVLWPRLSLGRWSAAGASVTAASLYANWVGVMCLVFGSGFISAGASSPSGSAFWNLAAFWILKVAIVLSVLSALIILFGLRGLAVSESPEGARVPVTTN